MSLFIHPQGWGRVEPGSPVVRCARADASSLGRGAGSAVPTLPDLAWLPHKTQVTPFGLCVTRMWLTSEQHYQLLL